MKKVLSILIMFLCVFTVNVFALNVDITNVEVVDKSYFADEVSNNSIDGNTINYNLKFQDYEQFITYKITLKNNTKDDYGYDIKSNLDYMDYSILDDNKVISGNSTKDILLKVSYKKEIPETLYNADNKYNVSDKVELLLNVESVKGVEELSENPKTGLTNICGTVLILLFISLVVLFFIKKNGPFKYSWYILVGIMLTYPLVINASMFGITINMNFDMEMEKPTIAVFDIGTNVNKTMKKLAGAEDPNETTEDQNIVAVKRSLTMNSNGIEVQSDDSDNKIYMWYDEESKTIYYYSLGRRIRYNEDSSGFYCDLTRLIELDDIRSDILKIAGGMLSSIMIYAENITWDLSDWHVENIQSANSMFAGFGANSSNTKLIINNWSFQSDDANINNVFGGAFSSSTDSTLEINNMTFGSNEYVSSFLSGTGANSTNFKFDFSNIHIGSFKTVSGFFAGLAASSNNAVLNINNIEFNEHQNIGGLFASAIPNANNITIDMSNWTFNDYVDNQGYIFNSGMLSGANNVTLDVSNWTLSENQYINGLFYGLADQAQGEVYVDISNFSAPKAEYAERLFGRVVSNYSSSWGAPVTSTNAKVDVSNINIPNVKEYNYMFDNAGYNVNSIEIIGLQDWDLSNVDSLYSMFYYVGYHANKVFDFDLRSWDVSGIKNFSNLFYYIGTSAENIYIDITGWDTSNATEANYFISYVGQNGGTVKVYAPNLDFSGVSKSNYYTFSGIGQSANYTELNISNLKLPADFQGDISYKCGKYAKEFNFIASGIDLTDIEANTLFYETNYATKANYDLSNWKISSKTDVSRLISDLSRGIKHHKLNLSNWDITDRTSLSNAFQSMCSDCITAEIDLSGWDTSNVTDMSSLFEYAFSNSNTKGDSSYSISIKGLDGWDTSKVTNFSKMFKDAYKYLYRQKIDTSWIDFTSATNLYDMFYNTGYYSDSIEIDLTNIVLNAGADVSGILGNFGGNSNNVIINMSGIDFSNNDVIIDQTIGKQAVNVTINASNIKLNNSYTLDNLKAIIARLNLECANFDLNLSGLNISDIGLISSVDELFKNSFSKVSGTLKLDVSNWDLSNITSATDAFDGIGANAQTVTIVGNDNWNI